MAVKSINNLPAPLQRDAKWVDQKVGNADGKLSSTEVKQAQAQTTPATSKRHQLDQLADALVATKGEPAKTTSLQAGSAVDLKNGKGVLGFRLKADAVGSETPRPADVEAARTAFKPTQYATLGISANELKRGAALVEQVFQKLGEPRIFVNRSLDSALGLLREGGRFSTIYDKVDDPTLPKEQRDEIKAYLSQRQLKEETLGTIGVGDLRGRTVYGSVGFSKNLSQELWDDQLLKLGKKPESAADTHLNSGIALTGGAITFVLKPEANLQSTFLPRDTYDNRGSMPVAREHLAAAVWGNIGSYGDDYFSGDSGSQALLKLPHDEAVRAVARFMTSDAINRGYMEAQVRAPTLDDVERIVIRRSDVSGLQGAELAKRLAEVQALAKRLGIPCEEATAKTPPK